MYNKKALRETQTLRTGGSKAEPKIFAPLQTPFPGPGDGQNLISWRWSLPLLTNPVWCGSMHAISSYRVSRPNRKHTHTHTPTHAHTDKTDYSTLFRRQLARSVIKFVYDTKSSRSYYYRHTKVMYACRRTVLLYEFEPNIYRLQ